MFSISILFSTISCVFGWCINNTASVAGGSFHVKSMSLKNKVHPSSIDWNDYISNLNFSSKVRYLQNMDQKSLSGDLYLLECTYEPPNLKLGNTLMRSASMVK